MQLVYNSTTYISYLFAITWYNFSKIAKCTLVTDLHGVEKRFWKASANLSNDITLLLWISNSIHFSENLSSKFSDILGSSSF